MTRKFYFWLSIFITFFVFLFLIRSILLPFVLGALTAYFLDPAAKKLEKLGLSRTLSTMLISIWFFFAIIMILILIVPVLANQLSGLVAAIPSYISLSQHRFVPLIHHWIGDLPMADSDSVQAAAENFSGVVVKMAGGFITGVFASGVAIVNLVTLVIITPVVTVYLLEDWNVIMARIDSWLPRQHAATIRTQIAIIDTTLAGFLRGQLNVCFIMAVYYTLLLSLAGLHFSSVVGIGTGLLIIIPYVGWMLGASIGMGIAFFQFDQTNHILMIAGIFVAGMVMEGYLLTPKLVGQKVGLHPVWIIFGMLAGGALFGFVGVLLAVPVTAVVGVLMRFGLDRYLSSEYYRGPARYLTHKA